jgi:hypothetical protein
VIGRDVIVTVNILFNMARHGGAVDLPVLRLGGHGGQRDGGRSGEDEKQLHDISPSGE